MLDVPPPADGQGPAVLSELAEIRGNGSADGGRLTIELDGTSNIVSLVIEPRAMRLGADRLTAGIRSAFDAARADVQSQLSVLAPTTPLLRKATPMLEDLTFGAERRLDGLTRLAADLITRLDRVA